MRKFLAGLLLLAGFVHADSTTPNAGLTVPDIGSVGWGSKLNANWSIIDSSFAALGAANTFTSSTTLNTAHTPQINIWNPTMSSVVSAIGFGGSGSNIGYLKQSNTNTTCSDLSGACATTPFGYGTNTSPTSGVWSIDTTGKMSVGSWTGAKSTATIWGNMLVGSGYVTATAPPVDGLRVQGNVIMDSSASVNGAEGFRTAYNASLGSATIRNITGSTQCLQTDTSGNVSGTGSPCGAGGGGASSLETFIGSARSSPTASITANTSQFAGSVSGSTFTFTLNSSSVTLLGPSVDASELPSDGYAATYVNVTGDTMSGQLTVTSMTATGAGIRSSFLTVIGTATVNGQSVCLEDGTDCPSGGSGDAVLASTQTWTGGNVFDSYTTFRGSITIGTDITPEVGGVNVLGDSVNNIGVHATGNVRLAPGGVVALDSYTSGIVVISSNTLIHGTTIFNNGGIRTSQVSVNGSGDGYIGLDLGGVEHRVIVSSTVPSAGQCTYWTSSNTVGGLTCGSGGSGTPGTPVNSVQYNSGGSFTGNANFNYSGSSLTILATPVTMSSAAFVGNGANGTNLIVQGRGLFSSNGGYGGASTATVSIYSAAPAGHAQRLLSIGTDQSLNQVLISNETPLDSNYGIDPGDLRIGIPSHTYKIKNLQNTNEIVGWEAGNANIYIRTSAADNSAIVLAPSFSTAVYINNAGGATFTSSATFNHANSTTFKYGIIAGSATIGGQSVCLEDGTDCPPGGGGAASSTLETFIGSARSSPTASITANTSQFTGSVSGSTFTFALNGSSVTLLGPTIGAAEIADGDHGDFSYASGVATLDADVVSTAEMADADHGDFTYSGGSATLDADVVSTAEMADADHGDFTYSGGVATLDTDSVSSNELNATGVEAELEAVMDLQDMQGAVTAGQLPADGYASTYVNVTGDTMTGQLTVTSMTATLAGIRSSFLTVVGTASVVDDAYSESTWNGSTLIPTKNAVRDQIEAEPAATRTLTNKTLDAEGTGNSLTVPFLVNYKAAVCQNTTASLAFSSMTAAPTATCVTGTNTQFGVAKFDDIQTSTAAVHDRFTYPFDATGTVDARIKWRSSATSGNVFWQLATVCVADAETSDPAFNTASTVADAAKGTTLQQNDASITGVTITGCAAGEELYWKLSRCGGHASDTLGAAADLISVSFTVRRQM